MALPALDALTKSVSTGNLERVRKVGGGCQGVQGWLAACTDAVVPRLASHQPPPPAPPHAAPLQVKTRHQRLMIRCETLRDELERFLHDDDDMAKMCLTRRKELEEQYREVRGGTGRYRRPPSAAGCVRGGAALG